MLSKGQQREIFSLLILLALIVIPAIFILQTPFGHLLTSPEKFRAFVLQFGLWAPVITILFNILQVIISPIPSQGIDLANGYLFGPWLGSVLSLIGISIGSTIAILLARRFGRPLVEKLITPAGLAKVQPYTRRRSYWFFFILFLLPATPDDLLCFAIGLTSIPIGRAIAIAILGRAPAVIATAIIAASGSHLNPLLFAALALGVSAIAWVIVWKTPLGDKINPINK